MKRPLTEVRRWEDRKGAFSALWRVPTGTAYESLRIELPAHYLVLYVRRGSIRVCYGATSFYLRDGEAIAVSTDEIQVEIPDESRGDSLFDLHLFNRMPEVGRFEDGWEHFALR